MSDNEKVNITSAFTRTKEELLSMDEVEFKARFRERCHHTMEIQTYSNAYRGKKLNSNQTETALLYMDVWRERGLSQNSPEYIYAEKILNFANKLIKGETVDLSPFKPTILNENDIKAFENIIYERRSVREWKDEYVTDDVIDKVLKTGLWAAHACNLQSIRYLVIREETSPGLFKGSDIPGGPIHIVILQDMRVYRANPIMPESNQLLDAGAAAQNIVLAAHAYGLGGCWLTFTSEQMKQRIREFVNLSDDYRMTTYIDIGWPDQTPYAPQRIGLEDAIFARK